MSTPEQLELPFPAPPNMPLPLKLEGVLLLKGDMRDPEVAKRALAWLRKQARHVKEHGRDYADQFNATYKYG